MKRYKITHIVSRYYPSLGGMERIAQEIAETQLDMGHEVSVITSNLYPKGRITIDHLPIQRLKGLDFANTTIIPSLLIELLKIKKDTIVHLHIAQAYIPEVVLLASKIKKFKYIAHIHTNVIPTGPFGFMLRAYKPLVLKRVLLHAESIVVPTNDYAILISEQYDIPRGKINVIPNGTKHTITIPKKSTNSRKRILFVGRLSVDKNIPLLIDTISSYTHRYGKNITVDIVGEGSLRKKLEDKISTLKLSDVINFLGPKTGSQLEEIYDRSDFLMLTSGQESFGIVLIEAMTKGLPIISANIPAVKNVVINGRNGLLNNPNPQSLSDSLNELITNTELYSDISENNIIDSEKYQLINVVKKINQLYYSSDKTVKTLDTSSSTGGTRIDYLNSFPLILNEAESIHVYEICKYLQEINCDVKLFTPKGARVYASGFQQVGIKTGLGNHGLFRSIAFQALLLPKVIRLWRKNKPDYIYYRANPLFVMPAILGKLCNVPLVIEVNGAFEEETSDKDSNLLLKIFKKLGILRLTEKFNYSVATKIITVTPDLKEYLVRKFKVNSGKIFILENGVDTNVFKPVPKVHGNVIGFVGGIRNWHGLSYIIEALPTIVEKIPEARLVLVGDGLDKNMLEQLVEKLHIEKHVDFIGAVDHESIPGYINMFDICLAYYNKDRDGITSPFKIYEYLSSGKPTIVSNIRGVGDKFSKITVVVEPESSTAFAKKVIDLLNDTVEQDRLSKVGREFILDGHSWKDVAKKTLDIIES